MREEKIVGFPQKYRSKKIPTLHDRKFSAKNLLTYDNYNLIAGKKRGVGERRKKGEENSTMTGVEPELP